MEASPVIDLNLRPLDTFAVGARVRIDKLCDCPKARCRLCAMGLTPGTEVEILSAGGGPCSLKVRGASLVLGHGMANKVLGHEVTKSDNGDGRDYAKECPHARRKSLRDCFHRCR